MKNPVSITEVRAQDVSIEEIHALYVEKALMGTPDHLRDDCAVVLGFEANRQLKAMGQYEEDVTPAVLGLLERIRDQEQVTQARAELNVAVDDLGGMQFSASDAASYAARRVLMAADAFANTVQAAADRSRAHYQCKYLRKASAPGAARHVQAAC